MIYVYFLLCAFLDIQVRVIAQSSALLLGRTFQASHSMRPRSCKIEPYTKRNSLLDQVKKKSRCNDLCKFCVQFHFDLKSVEFCEILATHAMNCAQFLQCSYRDTPKDYSNIIIVIVLNTFYIKNNIFDSQSF